MVAYGPSVVTDNWSAEPQQFINNHTFTKRLVIYTGVNLDDWLTMHRSITLVDLHLDAQNSYLFTYNTFIKILYMFEYYSAHLQEVYVVIVYICSHLQRVTIPEVAYIQLRRRPPEDEQSNAQNM